MLKVDCLIPLYYIILNYSMIVSALYIMCITSLYLITYPKTSWCEDNISKQH